MERLADITLVKPEYVRDKLGQRVAAGEATRTLVCTLHGISRQEWSVAAQVGLNPEMMALLRDSADYEGEELAEIGGIRYVVYRDYPRDDGGIELYLRKNIGVNV